MLFEPRVNFQYILKFSWYIVVVTGAKQRFIYCHPSCLMSLSDRRLLIPFVDGIKLRGTVNKFEGRDAIPSWTSWKNGRQQVDTSQPHARQQEIQHILGCFNRKAADRSKEGIISLDSAHFRPHMKWFIQFWTPSV